MKKIVKLLNCSDCSITRTYNHLFHKQTLHLSIEELLACKRCNIWILSEYNGARIRNPLACKAIFNHFAKLVKSLIRAVSINLYGSMPLCIYYFTYASRVNLHFWRSVKKLFIQNRHDIWIWITEPHLNP